MGIINLIFTVVNFSFGVGIRGWNRNRIIEQETNNRSRPGVPSSDPDWEQEKEKQQK